MEKIVKQKALYTDYTNNIYAQCINVEWTDNKQYVLNTLNHRLLKFPISTLVHYQKIYDVHVAIIILNMYIFY